MRRPLARGLSVAVLASCLGLSGCTTIGNYTGAAAAFATTAATTNAGVAMAVAIGVKAATDSAGRAWGRRISGVQQDALAAAAGGLRPGESGTWEARHPLGLGSERGEVRVARVIETPLALCKELLFSVEGEAAEARPWFAATACRQGEEWKWATAEPAVARWGNLH